MVYIWERGMSKTVMITGGAGFVGSNLTRYLLDQGDCRVVVYDNFFNGKHEFLPHTHAHLVIVQGDLQDTGFLQKVIAKNKPGTIFHLAALHFIPYCNSHPLETIRVNVEGTESVLEACTDSNVEKVVYASTAAIYGIQEGVNREDHPAKPMDIYGNTKYFGEHLVRVFHEKTNKTCVVARFFNIYGPNETNPHVIPAIFDQLKNSNGSIKLGNLKPKRDYIYVLDVVKALLAIDQRFDHGFEVFNVGTGREYSVTDLVETIGRVLHRDIRIEVEASRVRKQERLHLLAGIEKIRSRLNWQPEEDLESGLRKLIEIEYPELLDNR